MILLAFHPPIALLAGGALFHADESLKADEAVVTAAVANKGMALRLADPALASVRSVVRRAVYLQTPRKKSN